MITAVQPDVGPRIMAGGELWMDFRLTGKIAPGLGSGSGRGRAKALAAEGANNAVADIRAISLGATLAKLATIGDKSLGQIWDFADRPRTRRHDHKHLGAIKNNGHG